MARNWSGTLRNPFGPCSASITSQSNPARAASSAVVASAKPSQRPSWVSPDR